MASGPTDLANQAVFDMASGKDKNGDRTVGVITKCDVTQQALQVEDHRIFQNDHTLRRSLQVVDIVRNKTKPLRHGWFVVRNRTPGEVSNEITALEHHKIEREYFEAEPWNTIPEERRGTQALKKQLADLLSARIENVFPTLAKDVQKLQADTESALESLGTPRDTLSQKRAYLSDVALAFHSLIIQGLQGQYASVSEDAMKLRMKVRDANDAFARFMKQKGHAVPFMEQPHDAAEGSKLLQASTNKDEGSGKTSARRPAAKSGGLFDQTKTGHVGSSCPGTKDGFIPFIAKDYADESVQSHFQSINMHSRYRNFSFEELRLSDYMQDQATPATASQASATNGNPAGGLFGVPPPPANGQSASTLFSKPVTQPNSALNRPFFFGKPSTHADTMEIYQWIRNEIRASRGTELQGTLNPSVLSILFHKQAQRWRVLSKDHFASVRAAANHAVLSVLKTVCKDQNIRQRIEDSIYKASMREGERRSKQLAEHVDNLLTKHLQTSNEAFAEKVKASRMTRFHAAVERYRQSHQQVIVQEDGNIGFGDRLEIDMRDTAALFGELHMSNQQNLEDEIHDILKAYYEIARESFVEFVNNHVVEGYLYDKEGPVYFFSPVYVGGLTDEQVEDMAAEDEKLVQDRVEKEAKLLRLSKAKIIAERCMRSK